MSPLRFIHPSLSWRHGLNRLSHYASKWQFWITIAFFGLGVSFVIGQVENSQRVSDNAHAIRQACISGNDSRAATRLAWAKVESYIVTHSKSPLTKIRTREFFDNVLGPSGHRDTQGPLKDRHC